MNTKKIDLHVHSAASDGTLTPTELVEEAVNAKLSAFALTDHDTVDGIAEAKAAAQKFPIEFIPGVEISTDYKEKEIHIVGLFIDETNQELLEHLSIFRNNRDNRNEKMYELLRAEGFDISAEALQQMFPDAVLTRAHVGRFLLEKGYISSLSVAFDKYIGDGCRCFVPKARITPSEAIGLIHNANGKAILAHPVLYHMSDERLREMLLAFKTYGLDGIEALYSTYKPGDERYIRRLAKEYDLQLSGGSDFHGSNKPHIRLGSGMGHLSIPYEILENLRQ